MAAFTSLALLGLGLAGGLAANKLKKPGQQGQPVTAPGPTSPTSPTTPAPPDATATASTNTATAAKAGTRQRRKATNTFAPTRSSMTAAPAAMLTPRTLLGGY